MTEVSLAEHNNVVKALPSDRTDQPFGTSVLPCCDDARGVIMKSEKSGVRLPEQSCCHREQSVGTLGDDSQVKPALVGDLFHFG